MTDFSRPGIAALCPALVLALAALGGCSHAQGPGGPGGHGHPGHPPPPPPEAYQACQGKAEGDGVTLTLPDGKTLAGTCRRRDGQLVAAPAGRPGPGGPPPQP